MADVERKDDIRAVLTAVRGLDSGADGYQAQLDDLMVQLAASAKNLSPDQRPAIFAEIADISAADSVKGARVIDTYLQTEQMAAAEAALAAAAPREPIARGRWGQMPAVVFAPPEERSAIFDGMAVDPTSQEQQVIRGLAPAAALPPTATPQPAAAPLTEAQLAQWAREQFDDGRRTIIDQQQLNAMLAAGMSPPTAAPQPGTVPLTSAQQAQWAREQFDNGRRTIIDQQQLNAMLAAGMPPAMGLGAARDPRLAAPPAATVRHASAGLLGGRLQDGPAQLPTFESYLSQMDREFTDRARDMLYDRGVPHDEVAMKEKLTEQATRRLTTLMRRERQVEFRGDDRFGREVTFSQELIDQYAEQLAQRYTGTAGSKILRNTLREEWGIVNSEYSKGRGKAEEFSLLADRADNILGERGKNHQQTADDIVKNYISPREEAHRQHLQAVVDRVAPTYKAGKGWRALQIGTLGIAGHINGDRRDHQVNVLNNQLQAVLSIAVGAQAELHAISDGAMAGAQKVAYGRQGRNSLTGIMAAKDTDIVISNSSRRLGALREGLNGIGEAGELLNDIRGKVGEYCRQCGGGKWSNRKINAIADAVLSAAGDISNVQNGVPFVGSSKVDNRVTRLREAMAEAQQPQQAPATPAVPAAANQNGHTAGAGTARV